MKMTGSKKFLSLLLCIVLIATAALFTTGCNGKTNGGETKADVSVTYAPSDEVYVLGNGKTVFDFTVVFEDDAKTCFEIHTDKTTVGDALMELGLIGGDEGPYGLYVKTVNGYTYDYDADGKYWSFYIDGEYAMSGIDLTAIEPGKSYMLKVEKA